MVFRPKLSPAVAAVRLAVRESFAEAQLQPGDLVLVACSGGADSLALAAATAFEAKQAKLQAGAAVIDHGLQDGSAEVAEQARQQLVALGFNPVQVRKVTVGASGGLEAAARTARYQALLEIREKTGAKWLLLGHTMDDQAETVLLGLTRGSGARSLSGMRRVNDCYLRPMLGLTRQTTEQFCRDSNLDYWQDPHNSDPSFTRVRIRQQVLPLLEREMGPGVASALARTADQLREDDALLTDLAQSQFKLTAKLAATSISFSVAALRDQPLALRHRMLGLAIEALAAPAASRVHMLAIDQLLDDWHGQKPLTLPGVRVERANDLVVLKTTKTLKSGAC